MEDVTRPSHIIGPLTFKDVSHPETVVSSEKLFFPIAQCDCMLCDNIFTFPADKQDMLTHLYMQHRLIIADVEHVAFLRDYIQYWKEKFKGLELSEYCSTMLLDKTPDGKDSKNEKYYLLSDVVPQDNQLRRDLQQKRLERILAHQKIERDDKTYERECLFCRTIIKDTKSIFLQHLFEKHNFYIAKSENLVFIEELIESLSKKLDSCICIFCEKVFKDRMILKEHMRKKSHKRINPSNKEYDKYFISNYLEMGRNWQSYLKTVGSQSKSKKSNSSCNSVKSRSSKHDTSSESDNDWSDWEEKDSVSITCLFCKHSESKYNDAITHMSKKHNFYFDSITRNLNFYEKIKIVNYVRRQVHLLHCITCDAEFEDVSELYTHMEENDHLKLNDPKLWNQPEFYFPTYEDDGLLYCLEDNDSEGENDSTRKPMTQQIEKEKLKSHSTRSIPEEVALSVLQD